MSCLFKNHITSFGLFCLLFLSVLVSFCLGTSNVSAVSDISVTYGPNDSLSDWGNVFPTCTSNCLNDYHYLKIETTSSIGLNGLYFRYDGSAVVHTSDFQYYPFPTTLIFELPFDGHNSNLLQWYRPQNYTSDVTYTLMESLSSCPACPDPEPVPDPEDCPEVPVNPYDQKLDNITQAIYVATATLLVIYFFYCIYRMIIKGVK